MKSSINTIQTTATKVLGVNQSLSWKQHLKAVIHILFFITYILRRLFYSNLIALQCRISFCYTAKRINHTYTCISSLLPQSIKQSSLCYMVGSHQISILCIIVYICQSQHPISSHPSFPPLVSIHLFYISVSLFLLFKQISSVPFFRLPQWLSGKESTCNAGDAGDKRLIPGSGRSPGERNGNPLYILAWRIPQTEEPGRLQSMGLQRVRHD